MADTDKPTPTTESIAALFTATDGDALTAVKKMSAAEILNLLRNAPDQDSFLAMVIRCLATAAS